MRTAGLLLLSLAAIVLVAGGALCPPDTDTCVGSLLHTFVMITVGIALSIPLIPAAYLHPGRLVVYQSVCPDPSAPPPRG